VLDFIPLYLELHNPTPDQHIHIALRRPGSRADNLA
jgi:hypothetical protein